MHNGAPIFNGEAIDCAQCGYVHLEPRPSQEELDAHWDALYAGGYLYEQEKRQQWYWRLVYLERMARFEELAARRPFETRELLDYGTGVGRFVAATWLTLGWNVTGYERSEEARRQVSPFAFSACFPPYDGVHCSLVLEYVLDPLETLRHINELLIPGGVLCLVVPNEFNPLQRKLYKKWGYSPLHPHHVNYFTPRSLAALVKRAGFEVVEVTATFPIEALALAGLNYVKHPKLGIVAHWLRMVFEAALLVVAPGTKRRLYGWFADRGIGREIELWARKAAF